MKISIGKQPNDCTFFDDSGKDITKEIPASRVVITAEMNRPVVAEIEIAFIEVTNIEYEKPRYYVSNFGFIKGIILEDDSVLMFPESNKK